MTLRRVTAVVPLKAIGAAKTRMAPSLSPDDRALLLRRTFGRVMAAARECDRIGQILVVVGDQQGGAWAAEEGGQPFPEPTGVCGLNAALAAADVVLGRRPTLVLPADLPLVTADDVVTLVTALDGDQGVAIAPTADGGTGGLLRVPGSVIAPHFGPDSAAAHAAAALRAGIAVHVRQIPGMALDLDRPADIGLAGGWDVVTAGIGQAAGTPGYPAG